MSQGASSTYSLPDQWQLSGGVSMLHYSLSPAAQGPDPGCTLTLTLLGQFLILAASIGSGDIQQLTLALSQHVQSSAGMAPASCDPAAGLQHPQQQEAWRQVKDTLVLPIKTALCRAAGQPLPLNLLLLPSELRDRCLQHLQACSRSRLSPEIIWTALFAAHASVHSLKGCETP